MLTLPPPLPTPLDPAAVQAVRVRAAGLAREARAVLTVAADGRPDAAWYAGRRLVRLVFLAPIRARLRCRDLAGAERELAALERFVWARLPDHVRDSRTPGAWGKNKDVTLADFEGTGFTQRQS